ncbi:ABC transporter permease [Mycobacterium sp. 663a-19]|uniref:MlaE family ABC transporter permease n=1 Tax=Mycobacterium sp. 663a-19 TaxID=2986148 RepID=UPI002D1EC841|nr:ABC transporter permease [Mycobacterium sp. 663a-19]MEB3980779.1 ABC transporter permease [Mycobacterium sp. 663a-19]
MSIAAAGEQFPWSQRAITNVIYGWNRIGSQTRFYAATLALIPNAFMRYRRELLRLIAEMGLGAGALAVIGGAVGVFAMIMLATGSLVGVQGYNQFASIGVEALTGLAGGLVNIRFIVPATVAVALSATIGAGATAQLGAMRINEEIDALEAIGIRSIGYLASTRVIAGVFVALPLFCVSTLMAFFAARVSTTVFYDQEPGVYDHYFNTFLDPADVIWSFFNSLALTVIIMLFHTCYGFNATGGPAGVGEAVGRAVRSAMVIVGFALVLLTLAVYGQSGNIHFTG